MVGEVILSMLVLREGQRVPHSASPLAALRVIMDDPELRLALVVNTLLLSLYMLLFGGPVIGLYAADVFAMDKSQLNALLAIATAGAIPTAALGGPLADRFGRKRIISLAVLIYAAGVLLWTQVPVGWLNTALLFAAWAGFEMAFPGYLAWVSDIAPERNRAAIMATMSAFPALVSAALPAIVTVLYTWRRTGPFWLAVAMALALVLALVFHRSRAQPASTAVPDP
jgi:MFS family permease